MKVVFISELFVKIKTQNISLKCPRPPMSDVSVTIEPTAQLWNRKTIVLTHHARLVQ